MRCTIGNGRFVLYFCALPAWDPECHTKGNDTHSRRVMSTVPISEFDVDNEVTDSLGLRESGNDYQSINGLTEEECGVFRDNNPGLFRLAILN